MEKKNKNLQSFTGIILKLIKKIFPMLNISDGISMDSTIVVASAILPGTAAFFYALAYLFFYGYYFGGNSSNSLSLITLFIYPIPFNFKSLTLLGLFLAIIVIGIATILNKLIKSIKIYHVTNSAIDLIILFCIIVISSICIDIFFIGRVGGTQWVKVWAYPIIIFLIIPLLYSKNIFNLIWGFVSGFIIMLAIAIVQAILNIGNIGMNEWLFWITGLSVSYILCFGKFKRVKIIILASIILVLSLFVIEEISALSYINPKFLRIMLVFIVSLLLSIIICKLLLRLELFIIKIEKQNALYKMLRKIKKNCINILKDVCTRYVKLLVIILLAVYIVVISFSIFNLGVYISGAVQSRSFYIIEYFDEDNKKSEPIKGDIAAFKDDIYYISDKSKNLIIIRTDKIIITGTK